MSKIGFGYGSEWHLLRYLGYHHQYLINKIQTDISVFQGYNLVLKDAKFSNSNGLFNWENEYKGIDIYSSKTLEDEWSKYWPQSGNVQNWDAIAEINGKDTDEYIFIEAKAHLSEIQSSCGATSNDSITKIHNAFQETINYFGINKAKTSTWISPYYQFANRLSFLHFLLKNDIKGHLLFIYFYGDNQQNFKGTVSCPQDKYGWENDLNNMYLHLGINPSKIGKLFFNRVHKIFISTNPNTI